MIHTLTISDALALEASLLEKASRDTSVTHIKFWQSDQALVAPRRLAVQPGFAQAQNELAAIGWPVHVRATGGDVTPQGPGIVNVTLIYTPIGPPNITAGYDMLCKPMEATLGTDASRGWNPGAFCDGAYNVQWRGRKFAGTAQRLKRNLSTNRSAVLAHALMLMEPPSTAAIEALNLFLDIMDQPRRIEQDCHTGLPDGTTQTDFIDRLHDAYKKALA